MRFWLSGSHRRLRHPHCRPDSHSAAGDDREKPGLSSRSSRARLAVGPSEANPPRPRCAPADSPMCFAREDQHEPRPRVADGCRRLAAFAAKPCRASSRSVQQPACDHPLLGREVPSADGRRQTRAGRCSRTTAAPGTEGASATRPAMPGRPGSLVDVAPRVRRRFQPAAQVHHAHLHPIREVSARPSANFLEAVTGGCVLARHLPLGRARHGAGV